MYVNCFTIFNPTYYNWFLLHSAVRLSVMVAAGAALVVSFTLLHFCAFSCCRRVTLRYVTLRYVRHFICVCVSSNCKIWMHNEQIFPSVQGNFRVRGPAEGETGGNAVWAATFMLKCARRACTCILPVSCKDTQTHSSTSCVCVWVCECADCSCHGNSPPRHCKSLSSSTSTHILSFSLAQQQGEREVWVGRSSLKLLLISQLCNCK